MTTVQTVCDFLETFAPLRLAEDWDNVGLILGDPAASATKVMTCLTVTPESATEAIEKGVELIVSHHPLPFHATRRITTDSTPGKLIWELARAGVSIYSPHTAFDSTVSGINEMLCQRMGVGSTKSLIANKTDPEGPGAGRIGKLSAPLTLLQLIEEVKSRFGLPRLQYVGDAEKSVQCIATACGSGGTFLEHAVGCAADVLVTGEATFHTVLEARARDVGLVLMGHYFSERFAVEALAQRVGEAISDIEVWASESESDPLCSL